LSKFSQVDNRHFAGMLCDEIGSFKASHVATTFWPKFCPTLIQISEIQEDVVMQKDGLVSYVLCFAKNGERSRCLTL